MKKIFRTLSLLLVFMLLCGCGDTSSGSNNYYDTQNNSPAYQKGVITYKYVNFRRTADTSSDSNIIGQIYQGEEVDVIDQGEDFSNIIYQGMTGFVVNDSIRIIDKNAINWEKIKRLASKSSDYETLMALSNKISAMNDEEALDYARSAYEELMDSPTVQVAHSVSIRFALLSWRQTSSEDIKETAYESLKYIQENTNITMTEIPLWSWVQYPDVNRLFNAGDWGDNNNWIQRLVISIGNSLA